MDIRYNEGKISSIVTNINVTDLVGENGKKRFLNLMRYFTELFIQEMELNKADELIKYAEANKIDISQAIVLEHSNGKALCNISSFGKNIRVVPFISLYSPSFLSGWTFENGNMADVDVCAEGSYFRDYVAILTKGTLYSHDLFLHWVMSKVEENFYSDFIVKEYKPETNCFKKESIGYRPYDDYALYEFLTSIVEEKIAANKSVKINQLNINGLTAKEYIRKNKIWKYCNTENQLWKMCLYFAKPYQQVKRFVELNGC